MKPETCNGCPLYNAPGPIWGTGTPNARLIILGQSPGPEEIKQGAPFVGPSGNVLNRALGAADVSRTQNFITNVVKCFVAPGSPVPAGAVTKCKPLLDRELGNLKSATTILTLGAEAFNDIARPKVFHILHDRKKSRSDSAYWLRGCPLKMERGGRTYVIIPTIHPAFVMRTGFLVSPVFEADVRKAGRFSLGLSVIRRPSYDGAPSDAVVNEYIDAIIRTGEGGLDIETPESAVIEEDELVEGRYLPVGVIGLSAERDHAIQVYPNQFDLLRPLFDISHRRPDNVSRRPILWAYNAGFDFHHLRQHFALDAIRQADAMMAFHHLRPEMARKDLATCMSFYTDLPFHKNLQDSSPDEYNAADTYGVLEAGQNMVAEMRSLDAKGPSRFRWFRQSCEDLFWNHTMPIIPEIGSWNVVGAPYDQDKSDRMEVELRMKLEMYEKWWASHIPFVSWSSPKQLVEYFTTLGIKVPKVKRKRKNGTIEYTPSVDDNFLEGLISRGNQTALLIRTMRELRKAGDFLNIADSDGRVYCRAKPHGQVGGRIQTVNRNMQQVPEELAGSSPRDCIPAERPCDVVISADFSQIEFWAYAWYSNCKRALEIKESGDYLYAAFYEDIWNESFFLPGKPRRKEYRDDARTPPWKLLVAKSWPLGFTYGRGVPNPADQGLPIDRIKARTIYDKFHRDYHEFRRLHNELKLAASKFGYLQTVFGRLRRFPNPEGQHNEICAFPGQTTAVDVLLRNVLLKLPSDLLKNFGERSRIYFTVHDSAIMNINCDFGDGTLSRSKALDAYDLVKGSFESPIAEMDGFVFPAEVKMGPSWGQGVRKEKFLAEFTAATV
jgi:uracil-DNA glycosylase family 4